MAALGAVTAVAGISGSRKAAKSQEAALAGQAQSAEDQLAFAKQQYQDYRDTYGDLEESMVSEVEAYEPGGKLERFRGEAVADVAKAFDKERDISERRQMRYGLDPSQARFQESTGEVGRERALAEVEGLYRAGERSEAEDDKMFARKLAVGQFGKGLPGSAEAVTSAMRTQSQIEGQQAGAYGMQAQRAAAGAGAALRETGYWLGKDSPATTTPAGSVDESVFSGGGVQDYGLESPQTGLGQEYQF